MKPESAVMSIEHIRTSAMRNQIALGNWLHNRQGSKGVWAVFSDRYGLISWTSRKHNARKILGTLSEEMGEFLWLIRITAP